MEGNTMELELTDREIEIIVHSLKKQSWELSNPVISKVISQVRAKKSAEKEESSDKDGDK
jgi:hypothetical protein